ncbi:hypothetical protein [Pasteurella sp. PK-2025]
MLSPRTTYTARDYGVEDDTPNWVEKCVNQAIRQAEIKPNKTL